MKRSLSCRGAVLLALCAILRPGIASADEQTVVDFSRAATITGGWIVRALPSGAFCRTLIDDVRGTPRAMSLEIDLAALPPGTTGVALLPESPFAEGSGTLRNVGVIRSLTIVAELEGAEAQLGVVLRAEDLQETLYELPLLEEDGAEGGLRTLVVENPNYIGDVRRRELEIDPLYPPRLHSLTFLGFTVRADALAPTGHLLLRVKEVRLDYDVASTGSDDIEPAEPEL